jgi:large subunit ribosomal protein L17
MYKRVKLKKLGRTRSHRDALIKNQLRSLFTVGYMTTTTIKAKSLKRNADRLIGKIKRAGNDMVLGRVLESDLGLRLLSDAAVKYARSGKAAVRMMKVGYRDGDNAQVSKVELVGYEAVKKPVKGKKKKTKSKEVKPETTTKEPEVHAKKAKPKSLGASIREAFTGRQERARSRSGI